MAKRDRMSSASMAFQTKNKVRRVAVAAYPGGRRQAGARLSESVGAPRGASPMPRRDGLVACSRNRGLFGGSTAVQRDRRPPFFVYEQLSWSRSLSAIRSACLSVCLSALLSLFHCCLFRGLLAASRAIYCVPFQRVQCRTGDALSVPPFTPPSLHLYA